MRQMINKRNGRIAVYDGALIESGRWEEYFPPVEKPKGVQLKKLKGIGTLEVKTKEPADESIERKA